MFGVIKDLTKEQEALERFERLFRKQPCPDGSLFPILKDRSWT
jgi:hypothetical protein